jgi:hypothetical protein
MQTKSFNNTPNNCIPAILKIILSTYDHHNTPLSATLSSIFTLCLGPDFRKTETQKSYALIRSFAVRYPIVCRPGDGKRPQNRQQAVSFGRMQ